MTTTEPAGYLGVSTQHVRYELATLAGRKLGRDWVVKAGLWRLIKGGWGIHDYAKYQPDPAKVKAGQRGGLATAQLQPAAAQLKPRTRTRSRY